MPSELFLLSNNSISSLSDVILFNKKYLSSIELYCPNKLMIPIL